MGHARAFGQRIQSGLSHCVRSGGSMMGEGSRRWAGGSTPCDRGSALLLAVGMYFGDIVRSSGANKEVILHIELLRTWFRERPLSKAPMTPVLSEWMTTSTLQNPRLIRDKTASSRAMDSAQPMSRLAAHHLLVPMLTSHLESRSQCQRRLRCQYACQDLHVGKG